MKSNSFIESLHAGITRRSNRVNEIAGLNERAAATAEQLKGLEETGDITVKSVVTQIRELQTLVALLPRRITACEQALDAEDQSLTEATHDCITKAISPRARQLAERALAKMKQTLAPAFSDPHQLEGAARKSDIVVTLAGISPSVTIPASQGGVVRYAQRCLEVWNNLDAIEAKL